MRRPWNIVNHPVYSLATYHEDTYNMNILTYATAISMKPKLYGISVYTPSLSLEYMRATGWGILQFLSRDHLGLIRPLGKKSGRTYNKIKYLESKGWVGSWRGHKVLEGCTAYVLVRIQQEIETGDHQLMICKAEKYQTCNETDTLMFDDLIKAGLIL